jgi:predicted nuclease of predicted toxin-antitoxin system
VKIKLDENVHGDVRDSLAGWGHDASTVHDEGLAGSPDADVAAAVKAEERCLVTFDLDFANPRRYPPAEYAGIVVLRLHAPTARLQVRRLVSFFSTQAESIAGKLWILDETRARDWTP